MVTIDDIKNGLANYFDSELVPNVLSIYDEPSLQKFLKPILGTVLGLYIKKIESYYYQFKDNPLVKFTGVITDDGKIDMDLFLSEYEQHIEEIIFTKDTKIGNISFDKNDLEKLKECISNVARRNNDGRND